MGDNRPQEDELIAEKTNSVWVECTLLMDELKTYRGRLVDEALYISIVNKTSQATGFVKAVSSHATETNNLSVLVNGLLLFFICFHFICSLFPPPQFYKVLNTYCPFIFFSPKEMQTNVQHFIKRAQELSMGAYVNPALLEGTISRH